jgi:hypothetical protein
MVGVNMCVELLRKTMPKITPDASVAPIAPDAPAPLVIDMTPLQEIIGEVRAYRDYTLQVRDSTPHDIEKIDSWHQKLLKFVDYLDVLTKTPKTGV